MSYYALFKGLLLLSEPPDCLCDPTSFLLSTHLGALSDDLGCFPLDVRSLSPGVSLPEPDKVFQGITNVSIYRTHTVFKVRLG